MIMDQTRCVCCHGCVGVCMRSFNIEKNKKKLRETRELRAQKAKEHHTVKKHNQQSRAQKKSFRNTLIFFFARFHFHSTATFPTIIIYNICVIHKFVCQLDLETHARNNLLRTLKKTEKRIR